jgi:hypothetical protein
MANRIRMCLSNDTNFQLDSRSLLGNLSYSMVNIINNNVLYV